MSKVKLMSLVKENRGKLGDVIFSEWKGIPYVRDYVKTDNPNTPKQQEVRNAFTSLSKLWKSNNGVMRMSWDEYVNSRKLSMTGYNAFIGANSKKERAGEPLELFRPMGEEPLADFIAEAGASSGEITCTFTTPGNGSHITFFTRKAPGGAEADTTLHRHDAGAGAASPYTITGLEPGTAYHVYGVVTDAAYEESAMASAAVTASVSAQA